jgi:adenine-specific DNA-methyltransferase
MRRLADGSALAPTILSACSGPHSSQFWDALATGVGRKWQTTSMVDQEPTEPGPARSEQLESVREEAGLHLHWQGRRSYKTVVPAPRVLERSDELSFQSERGGNWVIEGDNLQAMVSLRTQYSESVDVIYIDPPYNRGGNDFRYSDGRFHDPDADGSDAIYVSNVDGGRHTKWLNYMAPRLVAMKSLMAENGVIFVSINDIELGRLLMLMDEIFDEKNRIGVITWRGSADNNPSRIQVEHEYIVCYAKDLKFVPRVWSSPADEMRDVLLEKYNELRASGLEDAALAKEWGSLVRANGRDALGRLARYTHLDSTGPYQVAYRVHNPKKGGYEYGVTRGGILDDPSASGTYRMPANGYRFPSQTMQRYMDEGRIVFPRRHDQIVQMKDYLQDFRGTLRSVIDLDARAGSYRLKQLFGQDFDGFRYAKPVELIELLVGAAGSKDALVLDAFAGSGTTGDAVMSLNARDGGQRRFVLIEEGNQDDLYARTLLAPRLKAAIELDAFDTGFTFLTTGAQLDREAILSLEKDKITAVICQTDRSGTRSGIRQVSGKKWVIGANQRGEALALVWLGPTNSQVNATVINEALKEAADLGLKTPIRIYGTTCNISETKSFVFCQIPDEILAALQIDEDLPIDHPHHEGGEL